MYVLVIGQLSEKDAGPHLSGSTARLKGWGDEGTCSLVHRSSPACRPRVGRSRSRSRSIIGRARCEQVPLRAYWSATNRVVQRSGREAVAPPRGVQSLLPQCRLGGHEAGAAACVGRRPRAGAKTQRSRRTTRLQFRGSRSGVVGPTRLRDTRRWFHCCCSSDCFNRRRMQLELIVCDWRVPLECWRWRL